MRRSRPTRTRWGIGALALALACACAPDAPAPDAAPARTAREVDGRLDFSRDDRVAHLLGGCARTDPFTADTSDLLPVLVAKTATAEAAVAGRARADLLAAGRAALPELRRAFERWFARPGYAPRLPVLLELAGQTGAPEARTLALEGLEHPSGSVRGAALRALARCGEPQDYERLAEQLAHASPDLEPDLALALLACDRARLEADFAGWLADPRRERVVALLAPRLAPVASAALRERVLAAPDLRADVRIAFTAAAAAAGAPDALSALRADLRSDDATRRLQAAQAALASGLATEVAPLLDGAPDPALRAQAAAALASLPDSPERRDALRAGLADADADVRQACLVALCARADAESLDRTMGYLGGTLDELQLALAALRAPMAADPALAERVLRELLGLLEGGARTQVRSLEKALGQVPLAAAAEALVARGRGVEGAIEGLPAHRWYTLQAANTGPEGRAWLRAQWAGEPDLLRRMDLIGGGCQDGSPPVRAFLEGVLDAERSDPWERLFAADLLARTVPAAEIAPLLKRASARVEAPEVRRAFDCLLWRFYGPEPT